MTKLLLYQGYGSVGLPFPAEATSVANGPLNARLFDSYDELLLVMHRWLAQIAMGASREHFVSASMIFVSEELHASSTTSPQEGEGHEWPGGTKGNGGELSEGPMAS